MVRSVLLLLIGAIAGGTGIYLGYQPGGAVESRTSSDTVAASATAATSATAETAPVTGVARSTEDPTRSAGAASREGITAVRVAAYEQAARATDPLDLESMIDFAAAAPPSRSRDLELKALLGRLAEIDPGRAVDFAQAAYLDTGLLTQAFEALARSDGDAAIVELASVTPPAKQRRIALAVLAVIGNNEQGIERVAAALPVEDEVSFEIDALLARAELNPVAALNDLIALNQSTLQTLALPRLAEIAARKDPQAALAMAETVEDSNLRRDFQIQLLRAWAETDPDSVFAFLETAPPDLLAVSSSVFVAVAKSDPDRLLAMIDRFPPAARNNAKNAAMEAVAERDPVAAIAMLDSMPAGQERETMLQVIARAYGRENPDLALAWVRSLTPPSDNAMQAVLQGMIQTDVDRAIDVLLAELDRQDIGVLASPASLTASLSFSMMLSMVNSNIADVGRVADRLLDSDNPRVSSMMSTVVSMWASRDSDAALNWTLANAERLDAQALSNVAARMASENLELAMSTLDRLPPLQRAGWINGLASQMVEQDVDRAIGFIERYRGQPGYQEAFGTVVGGVARLDPVRAAGMLRSAAESRENMSAVFTIAREWANRDPAAAARWAVNELGDPQMQTSAINNVASTWAQRDGAAAERWIFSLASGSARDAAVDGYLSAAAQVGQFEPRLLEAYSSEQAAQQGASRVVLQMGRTDPEAARRLADTYITDPAIRARTEEGLARSNASSGGIIFSNGAVFFQ
jgi:hypothetical protein